MNSRHFRWWPSAILFVFANLAHANTIPIALLTQGTSSFGQFASITDVPPDTLTMRAFQSSNSPNPPISFTEFSISNLVPDSVDRMLNYQVGDPPSYEWTITAANANTFGFNWLEFQNQLKESKPRDGMTRLEFFSSAPLLPANPTAFGFGSMVAAIDRIGRASQEQMRAGLRTFKCTKSKSRLITISGILSCKAYATLDFEQKFLGTREFEPFQSQQLFPHYRSV